MIKPINDYILLKEVKTSKEQLEGSIVVSITKDDDDTASRLKRFEVLAISDGYINLHTDKELKINEKIKVGSIIFMDKYSGKKVLDNGTTKKIIYISETFGLSGFSKKIYEELNKSCYV